MFDWQLHIQRSEARISLRSWRKGMKEIHSLGFDLPYSFLIVLWIFHHQCYKNIKYTHVRKITLDFSQLSYKSTRFAYCHMKMFASL
jgi:hypothetical protein